MHKEIGCHLYYINNGITYIWIYQHHTYTEFAKTVSKINYKSLVNSL